MNRGWVPRNATGWTRPNGVVEFDAVLVTTEQVRFPLPYLVKFDFSGFPCHIISQIDFLLKMIQNPRR